MYMEKARFEAGLHAVACTRVRVEDQAIEGDGNSAGRYDVFAWRASSPDADIFDSSSVHRA